MIDRANFRRLNPNYEMPRIKRGGQDDTLPYPPIPEPSVFDNASTYLVQVYSNCVADVFVDVGVPTLNVQTSTKPTVEELSDEELMLASPVLFGFSLSDKIWRKCPAEPPATVVIHSPVMQSSTTSRTSRKSCGTKRRSRTWCSPQTGRL